MVRIPDSGAFAAAAATLPAQAVPAQALLSSLGARGFVPAAAAALHAAPRKDRI